MAKVKYFWRCKKDVPMLDEAEEIQIGPIMRASLNPSVTQQALELYFEMTGFRESNNNAIYQHWIGRYGPPCNGFRKPLRSPRAKWWAACGNNVNASNGCILSDGPISMGMER